MKNGRWHVTSVWPETRHPIDVVKSHGGA
ncbi:hypothetical protein ACLB1Q_05080 [Escherichia coli]